MIMKKKIESCKKYWYLKFAYLLIIYIIKLNFTSLILLLKIINIENYYTVTNNDFQCSLN